MKNKIMRFMRLGAGCGECNSSTVVPAFPTLTSGFNSLTKVQNGGITAFAIKKCNYTLANQGLVANWNAAIASGDILVRSDCFISGTLESAPTTQDLGACLTTITTRRRVTLTINDIADSDEYDVHKLYNHLQANPTSYEIAFFMCDGRVFGFRKAAIDANFSIEETTDGRTRWTLVATFDELVQAPPVAPAPGADLTLQGLDLAPTCAQMSVALAGSPVANGATVALGTIAGGTTLDLDLVNNSTLNVLDITTVNDTSSDTVVTFSTPTTAAIGGGIASGTIQFNGTGANTTDVTLVTNDCNNPTFTFTVTWTV